jgi:hypothetical protein
MQALGVGAVYWPELAPLFEDAALVGVLELELQAFWESSLRRAVRATSPTTGC